MNNADTTSWVARLSGRIRAHAANVLILLSGLVIGASLVALRSCEAPIDHTQHAQHTTGTTWTCSMHPQIRRSEPGQCPICGMDLIPVTSQDQQTNAALDADRVVLSERARALAKLRATPVRRQSGTAAQLRLLGRFEPNETTLKSVTAWTGGRIDRLHVNVTGQRVRAGQVIATLYSPEVFAAHQDLLVAKRQVDRMQASPPSSQRAAAAALEAARERLRLLGLPDDELARMEGQDRPTRALAIRSPFSGTVIERLATEGSYVSTGTPLYKIADLSTLWLQLDAYENDLPRLSLGQAVQINVEALPGEEFEGKVTFIEPTLDAQRRTAQVRVQVDNRDGRLRPGTFAEATVATHGPTGEPNPLVVPATAPLFTGRRAIVYLEVGAGEQLAYEPRTVRLGPRAGQYYPVVAGLAEGDRVVTRGAFAVDADLQIHGGASMMTTADDHKSGAWDGVVKISPAQRQRLAPVLSTYLDVQTALADDDLTRAKAAAGALTPAIEHVEFEHPNETRLAWSELSGALRGHARHVAMAASLEAAREGFEALSEAVIQLLTRFGNPLDRAVRVAFCPMAFGSQGAQWVQQGSEIDNSYFGASMLSCGEVQQELAPGAYFPSPESASSNERRAAPGKGHQH